MEAPAAEGDFRAQLKVALATQDPRDRVERLVRLADSTLGYVETIQLDRALAGVKPGVSPQFPRVRVALLASSTIPVLPSALSLCAMLSHTSSSVFGSR